MFAYEKLLRIQKAIKVSKAQYNKFGEYPYRSCEDILCAAKPLLEQEQCVLFLSDDLVSEGDRHYVRANAVLVDCETGEEIRVKAYAREASTKKGMDESQITGASSSYARKYALNGLFLLDDAKDADTNEFQKQQKSQGAKKGFKDEVSIDRLREKCNKYHIDLEQWALQYEPPKKVDELTRQDINSMLTWIKENFGDD